MTKQLFLFSSDGCHLCEEALALCHQLPEPVALSVVDIVEFEDLVASYGDKIPVIQRDSDGLELFWPFSQQELNQFVQEY